MNVSWPKGQSLPLALTAITDLVGAPVSLADGDHVTLIVKDYSAQADSDAPLTYTEATGVTITAGNAYLEIPADALDTLTPYQRYVFIWKIQLADGRAGAPRHGKLLITPSDGAAQLLRGRVVIARAPVGGGEGITLQDGTQITLQDGTTPITKQAPSSEGPQINTQDGSGITLQDGTTPINEQS